MKELNRIIKIYTDGSSLRNPGPAAWAFRVEDGQQYFEDAAYLSKATNNQMEICSIIQSLKFLIEKKIKGAKIVLYSDSEYCINSINKWIPAWQKRNWKKADGADVLNQDLWKDFLKTNLFLKDDNKLEFTHLRGHSGIRGNERVDFIARSLAEGKEKSEVLATDY